jgi:hypothetical protein
MEHQQVGHSKGGNVKMLVANVESNGIDYAERAFLQGSFREALHVSNKILDEESIDTVQSGLQREHMVKLRTSLHFRFFPNESFVVRVRTEPLEENFVRLERAAAVALQSWSEMNGMVPTEDLRERGYRYLLPCLRYVHAHSISADLAVLLMQFCRETEHLKVALGLCLELLSSSKGGKLEGKEVFLQDEVVEVLCCRLLPFSRDADVTAAILESLSRAPKNASRTLTLSGVAKIDSFPEGRLVDSWKVSGRLNREATARILSFLQIYTTETSPLGTKETVLRCISLLETIQTQSKEENVAPWDSQSESSMGMSSGTLMSQTHESGSAWLWRFSVQLRVLLRRYLLAFKEERKDNSDAWKRRSQVAISVLSVWIIWKQRKRVAGASKTVLWSSIQPFFEIWQALFPTAMQ